MRKLTNFLLILLLAGAAQAILRHSLRDQRNKAAIERILRPPQRPGVGFRPRTGHGVRSRAGARLESDAPGVGTRTRRGASERRRR